LSRLWFRKNEQERTAIEAGIPIFLTPVGALRLGSWSPSRNPMSEDKKPDTSTRRLLAEYRGGNRDAEGELFERHRAALLEHVSKQRWMRGLSRHATPEDLVGETFLRVLASGRLNSLSLQGEGALLRFLFKVLNNVAVGVYRRHGRCKRGSGRPDLPLAPGIESNDPVAFRATDTTPTVRARLNEIEGLCRAQLSDREWRAWRLCEMEDCTSTEAAARLEITDAAVRSLVHRARKKILRVLLEDEAETHEPPR
jgi:RNA polymerase sigma factor (sigma-70 family)